MIFLGLLTAAVFAVANPADAQDSMFPPSDFEFHYEARRCTKTEFDTRAGTYTRVESNIGGPPVAIPLSLGPNQTALVYREIVKIGFFDYQPDFKRVAPLPGGATALSAVSTAYRMEVRMRGEIHTVVYDDSEVPRSEEAKRLLGLFRLIDGFLEDRPEVRRLPPIRYPCE